jgi:CheY-like chemotaxis protein
MNIQKALVVDDSKVAHLTLRKMLTERGIAVDWVGSGEDAIRYMEKQRPDIIFLDVMMPGMDGFETAHAITNNAAINAPPVIMCSANATDEDRENARRNGAIAFLSKPYTPAQMDQILGMVTGLPASEATVFTASQVETVTPASVKSVVPPRVTPEPPKMAETSDRELPSVDTLRRVAEKTARDVAASVAEQAVRSLAEEAGRKAAQAAVQAALEAAKKAATEVARASAAEAAKAASERVARQIALEVAQKTVVRSLAEERDKLTKGLEDQVVRLVRDALGQFPASKEFKQHVQQIAAEAVLPKAQINARETAIATVQEEVSPQLAAASTHANRALVVGLVALAVVALALIQGFLF